MVGRLSCGRGVSLSFFVRPRRPLSMPAFTALGAGWSTATARAGGRSIPRLGRSIRHRRPKSGSTFRSTEREYSRRRAEGVDYFRHVALSTQGLYELLAVGSVAH